MVGTEAWIRRHEYPACQSIFADRTEILKRWVETGAFFFFCLSNFYWFILRAKNGQMIDWLIDCFRSWCKCPQKVMNPKEPSPAKEQSQFSQATYCMYKARAGSYHELCPCSVFSSMITRATSSFHSTSCVICASLLAHESCSVCIP
jgi:hypothetical protein